MDRRLLQRFLHEYPFQPATALWRADEIAHVLAHPFPEGYGLDLGCGDGRLTKIVLDAAGPRELVGLDIDPQETALAEHLGIYTRVHTTSADAIPEPDASFDFVYSNSVLEHIPDIDGVLCETARLLKPGGLFLLTVPSDEFHACLRGPLLPGMSRANYLKELDRRVAHLRYWSSTEWRQALGRTGLTVERETRYLNRPVARRWELISRLTAGVAYALFRRKKHPLEIQRTLGMRKREHRLPKPLAMLLAGLFSAGLAGEPDGPHGCMMLLARKP